MQYRARRVAAAHLSLCHQERHGRLDATTALSQDRAACVGDRDDEHRLRSICSACEVENRVVIDRLIDTVNAPAPRDYAVVHADTDDALGMSRSSTTTHCFRFPPPVEESVFFHVVMRRHATR